jgi:hypothetical protein
MLSAERHLVTNSAPMAMGGALQSSPSLQAQKRRHTSAFVSEPSASSEQAVKRTKTVRTYSAKGTTQIASERDFENLRDEAGLKTSHSARFTEHSGFHLSAELPGGSIGEDFVNHEPTVLFRDTGSTIPDDSSAQERMLRQALSSKKGLSNSAVNELQDEDAKSSSFPWSASEQTKSAKSTVNANAVAVHAADDVTVADESNVDASGKAGANGASADSPTKPGVEIEANDGDGIIVHSASKPKASPTVEISRTESTTKSTRRDSTGTPKSTKSRKRKADEANVSDPPNSDDKAIGLPKERYQPRPSRRRATGFVEEPIDFSVRPEKAAKTKRTKTMATNAGSQNTEPGLSKELIANLKADVEKATKASTPSQDQPTQPKESLSDEKGDAPPLAKSKDVVENAEDANDPPTQQPEQTPTSSKPKSDRHIFVKPSRPTPTPKPATKSRRARTTIFEDNIEFTGSQRSPTLSQQQAEWRKLAAENEMQVGTAKPSQRKRKSVVVDDDEEDELLKDPEDDDEDEDVAPKKRGRGRPSKSKPKAKSAEKILDDSEDDEENLQEETVEPKKRGRGRPSKTAPVAPLNDSRTKESSKATGTADSVQTSTEAVGAVAEPKVQPEDAIALKQKTQVSAKENVTPSPSPQQPMEKTTKTPQRDSKPSPTQHSPIKSSSAVPLRVGLSKRQRIPSLLRTMKPPKC